MTDFMSIIKGRRSIRRFEEKQIPEQDLNKILESVQWSPSWANTQCWEIVLIKDQAKKEALIETITMPNPAKKGMYKAPVVLVVCGKLKSSGCYGGQPTTKHGDWFMFDLGIASQSICLTARHLGLGTVIVGQFDHDMAKGVLGVPEAYEVVAMIPVGYPAKDARPPGRREIGDFVHRDVF